MTKRWKFEVVFSREAGDSGYTVECLTVPGCITQSETIEGGFENIGCALQISLPDNWEDAVPADVAS